MIILGCAIYATGYTLFTKQLGTTTGGVTGLSNNISLIFDNKLDTGILIFCINIPLFILSFIFNGKKFTLRTLLGVALYSGFIELFSKLPEEFINLFTISNDIICVLCSGLCIGIGLGLVMKNGSSTGGTDIVMKMLHKKYRYLSGGVLTTIIDCGIILMYFIITRNFELTIFSAFAVVIENLVYDFVLYGTSNSKTVFIITTHKEEIIKDLFERTDAGATLLEGIGAYSNLHKNIIMCTIKNTMYPTLKHVVDKYDNKAFMVVVKSLEVCGEGFKDYKDVL